ncbi:DNA-binding protein [Bifidobacterium sp. ESL0690]|uniref:FitA-like ribbon-helix-helix domain-containing protein n=1 Tax=Bifidobacterium sp. ESL0690 TaxID=2983214 RepID=UPI0023F97385|nr:DNA-binding protein [Bifidobacterium sp. ESL0690]WEV46477.1 DNA-binding protein [Bifidobacterium sp. ESL0690]
MGTMMIRDVPDEQIDIVKEAAKAHNRSMEAEMRSNVAQWTAAWVAHKTMTSADLYAEMREFLGDGGLEDDEELVPPREKDDARPVDFGGES